MPVKRKLNKKRTKVPRNVKINSKSSKRVSQKKRGRRASRRQRGGEYISCLGKPAGSSCTCRNGYGTCNSAQQCRQYDSNRNAWKLC